jgi:hypothetical protein
MLACERTAALVFPAVSLRANCLLRLAVAAATPRGRAVRYSLRLAPLNSTGKKITPLRYADFYLFRFGSGLFYLPFLTRQLPRPPPLNTVEKLFYLRYYAGLNAIFPFWQFGYFARKKEYAKLAIPLTGCKGHALRFFEKISTPPLRFG